MVQAFVPVDYQDAYVAVTRALTGAPSALEVSLAVDGEPMTANPDLSSDSEAVFDLELTPNETHVLEVAHGAARGAATLTMPGDGCNLAITHPHPDSLFFSAGEPIELRWSYAGDAPTEFSIFAMDVGGSGHLPWMYSASVDPSATGAQIPGSTTYHWGADRAEATVAARIVGSFSGDLPAERSRTFVTLAEQTLVLSRQ